MRVQGFPSAALGFSIPGRDLLLSLPVGAVSARVSPLRGAGRRTSPETIAVDLCAAVLSVGYRSVASRGAAPCLLLWSLAPTDPVIVRLCCRACLFWFPPLPIRKNSASLHSCKTTPSIHRPARNDRESRTVRAQHARALSILSMMAELDWPMLLATRWATAVWWSAQTTVACTAQAASRACSPRADG